MPQTLEWKVGDRYRTEDGTVMTIDAIANKAMSCLDVDGKRHLFDRWFGLVVCTDCAHGHLISRITGTIQDDAR